MYAVRAYKNSDFETLRQWYVDSNVCPPEQGMLLEDGTFILEIEGVPALSQTVYLTQSKHFAYLEGMIKNPTLKSVNLEPLWPVLLDSVYAYASNKGYSRLLTYCMVDKVKEKIVRLGWTRQLDNLSAFSRNI